MIKPVSELDAAVTKAAGLLEDRFPRGDCNCMSKVDRVGAVPELIRCYLKRMQIVETVNYLKEKGIETSRSAVGRYWVKFLQSGIVQLRVK